MPTYVYGCDVDKSHRRRIIPHGMSDDPEIHCPDCGATMHRIPQAVMHYFNPRDTLIEKLDTRWRKRRAEGFRGRTAKI